jgi:predicted MFS family arabinose efflux permease
VPAGLELAHLGTWRTPFFAVAGLGLLVAGGALFLMPPMTGHVARARSAGPERGSVRALLRQPVARLSLAATAASMMSGFSIIPNIAAHLQFDLGYPRQRLGILYMLGGSVAFVLLRIAGRWVDRFGAPLVSAVGTAVFLAVLAFGFAWPPPWLPIVALFVAFMVGNSLRNVAMNTLTSRVPGPAERARFMSVQSAVQHMASAIGAGLSTRLLTVEAGDRLGGMPGLCAFSAALAVTVPFLLAAVQSRLARRPAAGVTVPAATS